MLTKYPTLSTDAITAMRAVNLLSDGGSYTEEADGAKNFGEVQKFIRCAGTIDRARLGFDRAKLEAIASEIRAATGDDSKQVMTSWHPDYGDYLRIRTNSRAYDFICYMKS